MEAMRHALLTQDHVLIWRMLHIYFDCFHVAVHQWICPLPWKP